MKQYTVEYLEDGTFSPVMYKLVIAKTKEDAYCQFMKDNNVYAAWVARYTTQAGSVHNFNTFAGNATGVY